MDNFKIIYKILKALEKSMDFENIDTELISHETLKISYPRWERILIMLAKEGYIEGIYYSKSLDNSHGTLEKPIEPIITMKGLEYLEDNSMMKKAKELVMGVSNFI